MLCSDIFRDYEADYSAAWSAEEVELRAQEGGRRWWEAYEEEEEEEGRGTHLLVLGMPSPFISPHSAPRLYSFGSALTFSVSSRLYFLALNCTSMPLKHTHLLASLRKIVKSLFICIILC